MGFEPTPTFVDQNTPVRKSFTLESGALDRSAILTCQIRKILSTYLRKGRENVEKPIRLFVLDLVAQLSRALVSDTEVYYGWEFESQAILLKVNPINWRTGVSIPVPLECESSALPFELVPLQVKQKYQQQRSNFM